MPFSIDHIVIAVTDLDRAMDDYRKLGFTVLPGGEHPRGSRNALVCFEDGAYLEIIVFGRPIPDYRWWQVLDRAGEGFVDYALTPDDFEADVARTRAAGIAIEGPIDGARKRPDGVEIAWTSARPPEPDIPFFVTDFTPRVLRVPDGEAARHANGVTGVAGVTAAVRDLAVSVPRYRALIGAEPLATGGAPGLGADLVQFGIGRQMLTLAQPRAGGAPELQRHLDTRGQGVFAVSFYGPETGLLNRGRSQGAPLEIVREP